MSIRLSNIFYLGPAVLGSLFIAESVFFLQHAHAQVGAVLEEIVVTARKREESLQDTPLSISAFTGDMLEQQHLDSLDAIGAFTPNMIFDSGTSFSGANSAAAVYIRGIGQIDFTLTTEPGVGIYLDGVYISQSIGSVLDLVDIERVEVLRGPQGTLFGRNTIGGAINVTSKLPDDQFHGDLKVTSGSYDRIDARGSVNVPITDNLYAKVSVATFNRDGFIDSPNALSGDNLGDVNRDSIRGALRFVPNDSFEAIFTADYSRQREDGVPHVRVASFEGTSLALIGSLADPTSPTFLPPPAPLPPPSFIDLHNILATVPLGEQGCLPPFASPPPFCPPTIVPNPVFGQPTVGQADVIDIENDDLVNPSIIDLSSDTDTWGVALTLSYDFGWATVKSITSYRAMEAFTGYDAGSVAVTTGQFIDTFDTDQFTQELQLSGVAMDGRLNWLLGFYHFEEDGLNLDDVEFTPIHLLSGAKIDNRSTAGFAQVTFDMTEKLSITGGLRYTDENKKFIVPDDCFPLPKGPQTLFDGTVVTCTQLQSIIDPKFLNAGFLTFVNAPIFPPVSPAAGGRVCCLPISDANGNIIELIPGLTSGFEILPRGTTEQSFNDLTPHASIAYRWTSDFMTYFSFSEGFKSGGFVQRVFPPKTEVPSFNLETAQVFEGGFKWTGFDDRVRVSAAGFHTDYDDLQIQINDGIAPVTRNAAAADINGFEVEVTAIPAGGWLVQGGVGYLDAEYAELDPSEDFTTDLLEITLDTKLVNAPEWSTNLGIQYTHDVPFGFGGQLITRLDWAYRSEVFNDALNFAELRQDGYHLLDLAMTYVSPGETWQVSFFGKNVFDKRYIVSGFANGLTQGRAVANLGRPAEWGVSFAYHFGE